ncbi:MAG TPA: hypothetical protein VGW78_02970 [Candidatus Babeliales bacterium]|jgi:hypothetical protein|nr:hypothetical protein [Candidatus Babeliales bacterium]
MKIKILLSIFAVINIHASYPTKQGWGDWIKGAYKASWRSKNEPQAQGPQVPYVRKQQESPYQAALRQGKEEEFYKAEKFYQQLKDEEAALVRARLQAAAASKNIPKEPSASGTPERLFGRPPRWYVERKKQQQEQQQKLEEQKSAQSAQSMKPAYYRTPRVLTPAEEEALTAAYGPGTYIPTSPERIKQELEEQQYVQSSKPEAYYRTPRALTAEEEKATTAAYGPGEYMPTSPEVYKGLRSERLRAYKKEGQEARAAREALKEEYYRRFGIRPHELEGWLK